MVMNEKKTQLSDLMASSMDKIREMVDSNTIIGQPIVTADGVTLIPVARLSFGFGCGGGSCPAPFSRLQTVPAPPSEYRRK